MGIITIMIVSITDYTEVFSHIFLDLLLGCVSKCAVRATPLYMCRSNLSSETSSFVNVIKENGYSIVEMNRKPVNSLGLELLTELVNVIDDLEADPACQGLILTSVSYKDVQPLQK